MKILYFTDVHARTKTPARRSGDFEKDVIDKLTYLCVTAQREKVDIIVCGGDLFDSPNPSYRLAAKVMSLIRNTGIEWHQVIGNHDVLGHNPDSYDYGILAFFEQLDNFYIMDTIPAGAEWDLKAIHYRHGIEEASDVWNEIEPQSILFTHAMITPKPVPFLHVTPSDVPTRSRVVMCGHYHDPWGVFAVREKDVSRDTVLSATEGLKKLLTGSERFKLHISSTVLDKLALFINPGSISRLAALANNFKRIPRALILEVYSDRIVLESLPLEIARASEDVFDLQEIYKDKGWETRVEEFLDAMENVKVEGIEAASLIINAAKARGGVSHIDYLDPQQRDTLNYALNVVEKIENKANLQ